MLERLLRPRADPAPRRVILAASAALTLMACTALALYRGAFPVDLPLIASMVVPIAIGGIDPACALALLAYGSWVLLSGSGMHGILATASVAMLPLCLAVRDGGSGERRMRALAHATGLSGVVLQLAVANFLPFWSLQSAPAWQRCLMVALAAAPIGAVLLAQRVQPSAAARQVQPLPLPPLRVQLRPNAWAMLGWLLWTLVGLILFAVVRSPDFSHFFKPADLVSLALQGALWVSVTGVRRFVLLPLLASAACINAEQHHAGLHFAALQVLVQTPALAWWWQRAVGASLPWWPVPLWCLALLLAYLPPGQSLLPAATMLVLAALVELGLAQFPRQVRTPGQVLAATRGRLTPFWPWYLRLKWRLDPVFDRLERHPRPFGDVLDLGCGPGIAAVIARLRAGTTSYLGVDLDLEKLEVARTLLDAMGCRLDGHWQLFRGRMPFQQALPTRFDTVLLIDVLHYWPPAEQDALLRWARTGARVDAELLLRDGAADALGGAGAVEQGERFTTAIGLNPQVDRLHFRTHDELAQALARSGWTVVERDACGSGNWLWQCRASAIDLAQAAQDPGRK